MQEFDNLTGKILIAAPCVEQNTAYNQSIIYIMYHSENGAIGFILNREIYNLPTGDIFQEHNLNEVNSHKTIDVHVGGPLDIKHGFFLHSNDYDKGTIIQNEKNNLSISSNLDIINDVMSGQGPEEVMLVVGYNAWDKGQLEEEMRGNFWIISEPNHELIFNSSQENSWSNALHFTGINKESFVSRAGDIAN